MDRSKDVVMVEVVVGQDPNTKADIKRKVFYRPQHTFCCRFCKHVQTDYFNNPGLQCGVCAKFNARKPDKAVRRV